MTPKEKAEELVEKYSFVYIQNYTSMYEVKQCALIAVEEMINIAPPMDTFYPGCPLLDCSKEYLQQVKKEIEKL